MAFLLHFFRGQAKQKELLPREVQAKILDKAKCFCWRPGADPKDWDEWYQRSW